MLNEHIKNINCHVFVLKLMADDRENSADWRFMRQYSNLLYIEPIIQPNRPIIV